LKISRPINAEKAALQSGIYGIEWQIVDEDKILECTFVNGSFSTILFVPDKIVSSKNAVLGE